MSAETSLVKQAKAPVSIGTRGVELNSIEELHRFAQFVASSPFAPKGFGSPEAIVVAIAYGYELGMSPMAALANIAVINGKPAIYGDAMLAVVRASGLLEYIEETLEGSGDEMRAVCKVKRTDARSERVEVFTVEMAKRAGLWTKQGPWREYPERMLKFRCRSFALRDEFGDVLKGLVAAEEAHDIPNRERNVTPIREVPTETPAEVAERKIAAIEAERAAEPDPEPEAIDAEEEPAEEPTPEPTDAPVPFPRAERIEGKTITNKALVRLAGICYGRRVVLEEVAREVFGCSSTSLTMEEAKLLADAVKSRPETRIQPDVARELEELCKARGVPVYQTLADYGVERAEDLDPETAAVMRQDLLN
jgi:hypothetical protein